MFTLRPWEKHQHAPVQTVGSLSLSARCRTEFVRACVRQSVVCSGFRNFKVASWLIESPNQEISIYTLHSACEGNWFTFLRDGCSTSSCRTTSPKYENDGVSMQISSAHIILSCGSCCWLANKNSPVVIADLLKRVHRKSFFFLSSLFCERNKSRFFILTVKVS